MSAAKIIAVEARVFRAPLKKTFKIALGEISSAETVIVRLSTDDGRFGYGEASPYQPVTGDSVADALGFINHTMGPQLTGREADGIGVIHCAMDAVCMRLNATNTPGRAGIDIALYDLASQRAGMPLYRFLGGADPCVYSDYTIALAAPGDMAQAALQAVQAGFEMLKIKAGLDAEQDVENLRAIRRTVGSRVRLRLDANQGWNEASAVKALNAVADLDIEEAEQPLSANDLAGLARLRAQVPQPIMLDESVHSPVNALRAVDAKAGAMINIKLMKSAGLLPALKINAIAEAAGLPCMVGCMMETRIGIAAGAHLVASQPNIRFADLDSHLEIAQQNVVTGGFAQTGGVIKLSETPGLGVSVDFDALDWKRQQSS